MVTGRTGFHPRHPLRPVFETRKSNFLGNLYADQKEMLDRMIEDLFIATCSALTTQEGKQYLYCVWPEAVEGLLPETDLIALVTTDQEHILVRWRDVQRIAGSLLEEQDFYPVRYKVTSFPSPAQLEQLREAAKVAL